MAMASQLTGKRRYAVATMTEDSAGVDGAAAAEAPPGVVVPPISIPEPVAPFVGPAAIAAARKADVISVGASAAGHLIIGLLIIGSLASAQKPPQAIPVRLVPADQAPKAPEKPPLHLPKETLAPPVDKPAAPPHQQQKPPPPPPKAGAAAATPAKGASGGEKTPAPAKAEEVAGKKKSPSWSQTAASLGMAEYGRKTTLPAALLAELRTQAKRCWTVPTGWSDPRQVTVTLRFQLRKDGAVDGDPAVVEFPATPAGAAAAKAAIEAVTKCGPYRLPAAQYDQWKDIQLELAP